MYEFILMLIPKYFCFFYAKVFNLCPLLLSYMKPVLYTDIFYTRIGISQDRDAGIFRKSRFRDQVFGHHMDDIAIEIFTNF